MYAKDDLNNRDIIGKLVDIDDEILENVNKFSIGRVIYEHLIQNEQICNK